MNGRPILFHELWNEKDPPLVTKPEMALLLESIKSQKDKIDVAVELGCYAGGTSIILASELKAGARYYAIDIFAINGDDIRESTIAKLAKYPNITLIEKTTKAAAYEFNKPIDWLFIDADHQDDSVLHDCQDWLPKVKSGGIVAFHDYFNTDFPSVARRVEETTLGWKLYQQADSLLIKIKP